MWDLLLVLTMIMLAIMGYSWLQSRRAPIRRVRATVARKRRMSDACCVTFRIGGAGEKELVVPEEFYLSENEGQWGILTFQGEIFKGFEPE
jgi:hypothetical protein